MKASQKKQVVWLWLIKELDAHLVDSGEEDIPGGEMGKHKSTCGLWKSFARVWVMGSEVRKVVGRRPNYNIFKQIKMTTGTFKLLQHLVQWHNKVPLIVYW